MWGLSPVECFQMGCVPVGRKERRRFGVLAQSDAGGECLIALKELVWLGFLRFCATLAQKASSQASQELDFG